MEKRLWYGITWPSAIITLLTGLSLIHHFFPLTENIWLCVKLGFVVILFLYHFYCGYLLNGLKKDSCSLTSTHLRLLNEAPTVLLFSIVFLVVYKSALGLKIGLISLLLLIIVLIGAIRIYKLVRESKKSVSHSN